MKAFFPSKGRESLLSFAHHHQHAGSRWAGRKSKDLIHQQTKEPNCTEQEKTTNCRRKSIERGGVEGVKEVQLLDRSHNSAAFCGV